MKSKVIGFFLYILLGITASWAIMVAYDTLNAVLESGRLERLEQDVNLRQAQETLDLAMEFGFDPLIVQIVQQETSILYHQRACKCPTWRFVRSDKELTYLILSIIQIESRGDYKALNTGGPAYGLTQLLLSTARQYDRTVSQQELLTIPKNLHIAVTHFVDLLETFHGNSVLAVIAWNRGAGAVSRSAALGESPDNGYAKLIFTRAAMRNAQ